MNEYKYLIRSQSTRMKILKALEWIPDKTMIRIQYFIKMHRFLHLKNPKRYTEKIQWYKLHYRNPILTQCVDKYRVREYLKRINMERYLIPLIAVWDNADLIEWEKLPDSFILKTTNGSGTNIFVPDKKKADKISIINQIKIWLTQTNINAGREWAYNNVIPRVVCEPILFDSNQHGEGLDDYKFFCFDGHIEMMWIDYDRFKNHKRVLFSREGKRLDVHCSYPSPSDFIYPKRAFECLIPIAEAIAKGFPHVRIDLYYVNESPYFGEMTFYSGSGYEPFDKDFFDFELGTKFSINCLDKN